MSKGAAIQSEGRTILQQEVKEVRSFSSRTCRDGQALKFSAVSARSAVILLPAATESERQKANFRRHSRGRRPVAIPVAIPVPVRRSRCRCRSPHCHCLPHRRHRGPNPRGPVSTFPNEFETLTPTERTAMTRPRARREARRAYSMRSCASVRRNRRSIRCINGSRTWQTPAGSGVAAPTAEATREIGPGTDRVYASSAGWAISPLITFIYTGEDIDQLYGALVGPYDIPHGKPVQGQPSGSGAVDRAGGPDRRRRAFLHLEPPGLTDSYGPNRAVFRPADAPRLPLTLTN